MLFCGIIPIFAFGMLSIHTNDFIQQIGGSVQWATNSYVVSRFFRTFASQFEMRCFALKYNYINNRKDMKHIHKHR